MKFFYEKFWVPVFGYILSKFVFLIEGNKQDLKKKKKKYIKWFDNDFIKFLFNKYVYCRFDISNQKRYKIKKCKLNEI